MAGLAAVGGIVSGVAGAAGSMMGASGQAAAMETQARVKQAQGIAERRMGVAEQGASTYDALEQGRTQRKAESDARAYFASSGGGVDGSARDFRERTNLQAIYKRDYTLAEGAQKKQNRDFQADILGVEAGSLLDGADRTRTAGIIGGVSQIFGGFSGAAKSGGIGGSSAPSGLKYGS